MAVEQVSKVLIADGCLHLVLASGGRDGYQYIYREAMSVYWDPQRKSFKCSTSIPGLPFADLLRHITRIAGDFGVDLCCSPPPEFVNLSNEAIALLNTQIMQLASGCS